MRFRREVKRGTWIAEDDERGEAAHRRLGATGEKRSVPQDACGSKAAAER